MSKIKNGGLDQYGAEAEPFEQQQFGTAGVEGVKTSANDDRKKTLMSSCLARPSLQSNLLTSPSLCLPRNNQTRPTKHK